MGEVEAEAVEQCGLSSIRPHAAAQPQLASILGWQHDVGALNAFEFVEDRAGGDQDMEIIAKEIAVWRKVAADAGLKPSSAVLFQ